MQQPCSASGMHRHAQAGAHVQECLEDVERPREPLSAGGGADVGRGADRGLPWGQRDVPAAQRQDACSNAAGAGSSAREHKQLRV